MQSFFQNIKLPINDKLYLKDPQSSEIGNKILNESIELINEIGFEKFTFKKLASKISTTEASIYRYFESKHKLLLYLINWYWSCIATRLLFETSNISDSVLRLKKAIHILTAIPNPQAEQVLANEIYLKEIIINEAWKAFLTKDIDSENKDGVFSVYKSVVNNVVQMIKTINPDYPYPNMLVTTVIEGSNQQRYFGQHLPKLTNSSTDSDIVEQFYQDMIFKAIQHG